MIQQEGEVPKEMIQEEDNDMEAIKFELIHVVGGGRVHVRSRRKRRFLAWCVA